LRKSCIRLGRHATYDRVVFDISGAMPNYFVRYVPAIYAESGAKVPLKGTAVLAVSLHSVDIEHAPAVPAPTGLPAIRDIKIFDQFEGYLGYGLGLSDRNGFRVIELQNPTRLVIDIAHDLPAPTSTALQSSPLGDSSNATLTAIRTAAHPTYDRVVFQFQGPNTGLRYVVGYQGAWNDHKVGLASGSSYTGAWNSGIYRQPFEVPNLPEGNPTLKPEEEDAAHFMVRMVHQYPHQVTIYGAGPLTNIALAIRLDPHFAELAQQLVIMGGSLNPQTESEEWVNTPRREFNIWFDPEAASITLTAPWAKITTTTIDASIQAHLSPILRAIAQSQSIPARYLVKYAHHDGDLDYVWDELAAITLLDPTITRRERYVYMDVSLDHGPTYGDLLTWSDTRKPQLPLQKVHAQIDIDVPRLQKDLIELFTSPTPNAQSPAPLPAN